MTCRHCRKYRNWRKRRMTANTLISDPARTFERVYCVNLDRRPDRWRRFAEGLPADWPFPDPVRVRAIDGKRVKHPDYWTAGGGAWGCYTSHLRLIETCLNEGVRSVLLLEDDALFPPGFTERVTDWLCHVPADWQMLYLGGQHLFAKAHPPIQVGPELWQPYNVNRTHAFAIQGDMLQIVYHHLLRHDWHRANHIDHHLGRLHQRRQHRIYCPPEWLVGQATGKSNISGREPPDRFWKPAVEIASEYRVVLPPPSFVAVLGLHSSGSSALCQALWHLGLWFGEQRFLQGYWGKDSPAKGGEHRELAEIMDTAMPLPVVQSRKKRQWLWRKLKKFIAARQAEAATAGERGGVSPPLPAAKYPQLCQAGRQLRNLCGQGLRLIVCDRPVDESIASLVRRTQAAGGYAEQIAAHQRWLAAGRDALAAEIPDQVCRVAYDQLLADPAGQLTRIADWLGLQPTADQLAAAVAAIDPAKRHVTASTFHSEAA
jgi:hypothetical protein